MNVNRVLMFILIFLDYFSCLYSNIFRFQANTLVFARFQFLPFAGAAVHILDLKIRAKIGILILKSDETFQSDFNIKRNKKTNY